jgi:hypothetical protein
MMSEHKNIAFLMEMKSKQIVRLGFVSRLPNLFGRAFVVCLFYGPGISSCFSYQTLNNFYLNIFIMLNDLG